MDKFVESLNRAARAYSVFSRALFYYDPAFEKADEKPADADHKYADVFANLPKEKGPSTSAANYKQVLFVYQNLLRLKAIKIYTKALTILHVSYKHISSHHKILLERLGKSRRQQLTDRSPQHADTVTSDHISQAIALALSLEPRFKGKKQTDPWFAYDVEFDLIERICNLVIEEIDFQKKRINEIENILHHDESERLSQESLSLAMDSIAQNEKGSQESLKWAIRGIYATAIVGLLTLIATIVMPLLTSNNQPTTASLPQLQVDKLSVEIEKMGERISVLTNALEKLAAAQTPVADSKPDLAALISEITAFRESLVQNRAQSADSMKALLASIETSLNVNLEKLSAQLHKDDKPLLDELKAINESIAALKTAIESRPPPTIIIEDSSKRKHGILNWF